MTDSNVVPIREDVPVNEVPQIKLDEMQTKAVELCLNLNNRMVAVTGAAGTGKTSILRIVYDNLKANAYKPVLCAPTGKAAKRIYEATGIPAMTIHRLLEYPHPGERDPKTGKALRTTEPKRHRDNPLEYDVVLCDEYAMVNNTVHRNLVDALPRGGALRCFGDVHQLQPIEQHNHIAFEGKSPFKRVLEKFAAVHLETIHRQTEGSGIVMNGARILQGRCPTKTDDFVIVITENPPAMIESLIDEEQIDVASIQDQVICLMNKDWVGSYKLSLYIQSKLRKENDKWIDVPRYEWAKKFPIRIRPLDKVIWTQNDYQLQIFNGETGIVTDTNEFGEITIDFGDREAVIPPIMEVEDKRGNIVTIDPRRNIDLAYAITTHKTQGSEYRKVVYVMNKSNFGMQCRPNFYTAVTRARQQAIVVSDMRSFQTSVTKQIPVFERKKKAIAK